MSTRVTIEDWPTLTEVPRENWRGDTGWCNLGSCDTTPAHGSAWHFLQTPDHRAIAVCERCLLDIQKSGAKI